MQPKLTPEQLNKVNELGYCADDMTYPLKNCVMTCHEEFGKGPNGVIVQFNRKQFGQQNYTEFTFAQYDANGLLLTEITLRPFTPALGETSQPVPALGQRFFSNLTGIANASETGQQTTYNQNGNRTRIQGINHEFAMGCLQVLQIARFKRDGAASSLTLLN